MSDKPWRAEDAKRMTFDQMTARAQFEWDRAEKAEVEAAHYEAECRTLRQQLEDARARIAELEEDAPRRTPEAFTFRCDVCGQKTVSTDENFIRGKKCIAHAGKQPLPTISECELYVLRLVNGDEPTSSREWSDIEVAEGLAALMSLGLVHETSASVGGHSIAYETSHEISQLGGRVLQATPPEKGTE